MILTETAQLDHIPRRIISLVPSQSELLSDLGLEQQTVGITKFCVHPDTWFRTKQRVGGTKTVNMEAIRQLGPDLIIANKEENVQEQVELLAREYPVWLTDISNLDDALQMINDIGALTGKNEKARDIRQQISSSFSSLNPAMPVNCAYLIWSKPYMAAGGDTFIHDMLTRCGFNNVFADKMRYPEINTSELQAANCELLLLSSEPYPFKQKHIDELAQQLTDVQVMLVDGEMFSWYGSRLLQAPAYFQELINSLNK
jgi:ABC-type Fe3+-hydroxamate transport system substrate-binding protein